MNLGSCKMSQPDHDINFQLTENIFCKYFNKSFVMKNQYFKLFNLYQVKVNELSHLFSTDSSFIHIFLFLFKIKLFYKIIDSNYHACS